MVRVNYSQEDHILLFRAFSDETRLNIIQLLAEQELCACRLLESLTIGQSTLSYHMKILTEAKLVRGRKEGTWMWYSLDKAVLNSAANFLVTLSAGER